MFPIFFCVSGNEVFAQKSTASARPAKEQQLSHWQPVVVEDVWLRSRTISTYHERIRQWTIYRFAPTC